MTNRSKPFLGETTDRDKAFSGIDAFELKVVQDRFGHYTRKAWQRESQYTKSNVPRYLRCANPRCQQGGLDLQQIVNFWPSGEQTFSCNGHEGSSAGRRRGDPCDNSFVVTLTKSEDE
jgi:hypothetical protein